MVGPERNRSLYAVSALSASDIWAVGTSQESKHARGLVRHWDGSHWTMVRPPHSAPGWRVSLRGVSAVTTSDVWAVGVAYSSYGHHPIVMHWDGDHWSHVATPHLVADSELVSVKAVSTNDVWAVGDKPSQVTHYGALIEHWDGSSWQRVAAPKTGYPSAALLDLAVVSASDIWAVGYGSEAFLDDSPLAEHWDGTRWHVVPTDKVSGDAYLSGVTAISPADVWAVGSTDLNGRNRTVVEHWDGVSWSRVDSPNPRYNSYLDEVDFTDSHDGWAVGSTDGRSTSIKALIEHWDGTTWVSVPYKIPGGPYSTLVGVAALTADDAWAVGSSSGQETGRTLREHWDGASWSSH